MRPVGLNMTLTGARMTTSTFTESTTHDLWVEARQFNIDISRPTASTIRLTITRPAVLEIADGAMVILGSRPADANDHPEDGTKYTPSLTWGDVTASRISDHQVVAMYSNINSLPWPTGTLSSDGSKLTWHIDVAGTDANVTYYASIHATSNVLQYYPFGIQSYPLESAPLEKAVVSYTGSILSLPFAPTAPTQDMVYFDQQLQMVQYWDSARGVWVPTRSESIMSGEYNPGIPGQAYMLQNTLKVFADFAWHTADASNLKLLTSSSTWVPFVKISGATTLPTAPLLGEIVYDYTSRRVQYWDGSIWQIPGPTNTLFGAGMIPAFTAPFTVEFQELITPYIGLLFYNTARHRLYVFNGSAWKQANTEQEGTPISDKVGIGNDGTYDQRLRLINILKAQLGWPAQCVELAEEQFNVAIDNALDTYRQLSVGAYEQRYMVYMLMPNQQTYFLNSPIDRTDAVVSVMKVHRLNVLGVTGAGPDNTWGMAYAQQFAQIANGGGALLDAHLIYSWSEEFNRIFAGDIPFVWNEARRELFLKRAIRQNEKVVLEVEIERSEQELMSDRWCKQFLQNWALAECKEMLGMIRSKYTSGSPGPSGTLTLNGDTLLSEARQDFTELKQALLDYEHNNAEHGNLALLIG